MLSIIIETSLRLHPLFLNVPAPIPDRDSITQHTHARAIVITSVDGYNKEGCSTKPPPALYPLRNTPTQGEAQNFKETTAPISGNPDPETVSPAEPDPHKRLTWDWESAWSSHPPGTKFPIKKTLGIYSLIELSSQQI